MHTPVEIQPGIQMTMKFSFYALNFENCINYIITNSAIFIDGIQFFS